MFIIILMKIRSILAGIFIAALLISILMHQILKINYKSELEYGNEKVSISRDVHNIPEIHAPSFKSALYAWGYVTAEDRLFQLAFRRASIRGELSKYLGLKAIEVDKMFREINLAQWSKLSADKVKHLIFSFWQRTPRNSKTSKHLQMESTVFITHSPSDPLNSTWSVWTSKNGLSLTFSQSINSSNGHCLLEWSTSMQGAICLRSFPKAKLMQCYLTQLSSGWMVNRSIIRQS